MKTPQEVRTSADQKMGKTIDNLKLNLSKVRTGRAHVGLMDHIQVDYYGNPSPLNQVANVTLIDSRTIGVQPWEKKMVAVVEKAIRESDIKHEGEETKIAVRNIRRDANEALKKLVKDKLISEDEERRAQDDTQKLTDKYIAEIDKLLAQKESEIMTV